MRIAALLTLLLCGLTCAARADEYGPHPAIRAIRAAIPVLLARYVKAVNAANPVANPVTVHDIVIDGDAAVATWSAGSNAGLIALARHPNGWWVSGEAHSFRGTAWWYGEPGYLALCASTSTIGPTSHVLISDLHLSRSMTNLAARHVAEIATADTALSAYRAAHPEDPHLLYRTQLRMCDPSNTPPVFVSSQDGFFSSWTLPRRRPRVGVDDITLRGRAPTASEMAPSRGADAVYFFTLQSKAAQNVSLTAGSTLDVWAPFVLDPRLHYTLTLALGDPTIGPLEGTLSDNTMHFILPAFSAPPSVELMGEIDGDP